MDAENSSKEMSDEIKCENACTSDHGCTGFYYDGNICRMYKITTFDFSDGDNTYHVQLCHGGE